MRTVDFLFPDSPACSRVNHRHMLYTCNLRKLETFWPSAIRRPVWRSASVAVGQCGVRCAHISGTGPAEYEWGYPDDEQPRAFRMHLGCVVGLWETLRRKRGLDPTL